VTHRSDRLSIEISPRDSARSPIALPRSAGAWWLVAGAMFSYLLFYFVGLDQGAVFGLDMHEFMHDVRHVASFPCH
jgi:cobalt transporter subunit CbtB